MEVPIEESRSFVTAVALRHLFAITLTLALIGAVTYLVPSFARVRPWVRGEGLPVVRLFVGERQTELPDFQGSTASVSIGTPLPAAKMPVAVTKRANEATGVHIAPEEYAGLTVPLENAETLSTFFEALRRTAEGAPSAITRIAHYGDSAVAADEISSTARRKLQTRFGDSGHGFMLTAKGNMFYGHRDVVHRESSGWQLLSIVRRQLRAGYYGYGGIVATGQAGEYASFGTVEDGAIGRSVSRFELFYQRFPAGGELRMTVDKDEVRDIQTHADSADDAWETIHVPDGRHSLVIRPRGEVRLYGVSQERDTPGVVYDALGLVGARADRLLDADPKHMADQIAHRSPDLLVLGFGGNEAGNDHLDRGRYERDLIRVVKLMRAGKPSMSCLLFGPLDQGQRNDRGDIVTLRALPMIVDVQRHVAISQGCAFFDTYKTMGGQNSITRWYHSRPRLFSPDFRHATPEGYSRLGFAYYQALLKGFADYLAKH